MNKSVKGIEGERAALKYLQNKGYLLLERNYRAQRCEIDLIMQDNETTVFIEVKARSGVRFGLGTGSRHAAEAGEHRKSRHRLCDRSWPAGSKPPLRCG